MINNKTILITAALGLLDQFLLSIYLKTIILKKLLFLAGMNRNIS